MDGGKNRNRAKVALFAVYLAALLRITVFRHNFSLDHLFGGGTLNLSFFTGYIPLLAQKRWWRFLYLFVGNMAWFVPFGVFLRIRWNPGKGRKAIVWGFALSFAIEGMQYLFGTGVSELDDLILNTLGTWIGWKAYPIIQELIQKCLEGAKLWRQKGRR
ncbi:MAG: VanZ family protein [Lachnospiraceae bacterium]|nr:VanZ family protein [Lachnospiraceae bacterium]MCI9183914.1 VanZ family protein [Lachnospiraceae bacterium]